MAASEAPEPPPRNPDKINASLKQTSETVMRRNVWNFEHGPNWLILSFHFVKTEIIEIVGCMRSTNSEQQSKQWQNIAHDYVAR